MNVITFIYLEGIFCLRKTLANILTLKKCRLEINFFKKHSEISETFSASFLRIAFRTLSVFLQILSMVIDLHPPTLDVIIANSQKVIQS